MCEQCHELDRLVQLTTEQRKDFGGEQREKEQTGDGPGFSGPIFWSESGLFGCRNYCLLSLGRTSASSGFYTAVGASDIEAVGSMQRVVRMFSGVGSRQAR